MKLTRINDVDCSFKPFSIKISVENEAELLALQSLAEARHTLDGQYKFKARSFHEANLIDDFLRRLLINLGDR